MEYVNITIDLFSLLMLPLTIIGGITSLFLWRRTGFWAPKYIHFLANFSGLIMLGFCWLAISVKHHNVEAYIWLVVIVPSLIYFIFGFHGREIIKKHLEDNKNE